VPLGAHMSIQGGFHRALLRGKEMGCETVQIFTKSNIQWAVRRLTDSDIRKFEKARDETGIHPVVGHDCYLINLAATNRTTYRRSVRTLKIELERANLLGLPYLIIHPGAHMGAGEEKGIAKIADSLSAILDAVGGTTQILLENTAGQGSNIGYRFEHLREIMERTEDGLRRLGVCFDTCHAFAAGYEMRTPEGYDETFRQFDSIVGLERLKVFHLNDSIGDIGSRLDRHQHIGRGKLGIHAFRLLMRDARFRHLPMYLETPKGTYRGRDWDKINLSLLRRLREGGD